MGECNGHKLYCPILFRKEVVKRKSVLQVRRVEECVGNLVSVVSTMQHAEQRTGGGGCVSACITRGSLDDLLTRYDHCKQTNNRLTKVTIEQGSTAHSRNLHPCTNALTH